MKKNLPEILDIRFQIDHTNPKKNQLHQEYRDATNIARLFMILISHKKFLKKYQMGIELLKLILFEY